MEFKKITIVLIFFLLFSGISFGNTDTKNYISMTVNSKEYNFFDNPKALIKHFDSGKSQIIIGVTDTVLKAELIISINCIIGQELSEINFSTQNDQIMIIFKSSYDDSFVIVPSIRLAKDNNDYIIKQSILKDGSGTVFKKSKPDWSGMTKAARLSTGKGIIHHKEFDNTDFVINIKPVIKEGIVVSLNGSFSGKAKGKNNLQPDSFINILNGKFQVEVQNK